MAQHTASLTAKKDALSISRSKRVNTPIDCVGCGGKKKRQHLFCKTCRVNFLAARARERELDEMFEHAISA